MKYNFDYYERGLEKGISGYMNYSWLPEMSIKMAHYIIEKLNITRKNKILDFGCAKGYMVKSFRILDFESFGVDISDYAIKCLDKDVKEYCKLIYGCNDPLVFERQYEWMIAKDVFEHIPEQELKILLTNATSNVNKIFAVIPLAADDIFGKYIIQEYDGDITHIIAKSKDWWVRFFENNGWEVEQFYYSFSGCKENWTSAYKNGNGFFVLKK